MSVPTYKFTCPPFGITDSGKNLKCRTGVTFKYMRFLCHENRSTGSVEDSTGPRDSTKGQEPNALSSWKEKYSKIQNLLSPQCSCALLCLPQNSEWQQIEGKLENLLSYHIYRMNNNKWRQYKILLQIFASDDNKQLDWATEIWYGGKL